MVRAASSQFNAGTIDIHKIPFVHDLAEITQIIKEISTVPGVIVYTLVLPELQEAMEKEAAKYNLPTVDIMTPLLNALTKIEGKQPKGEPGLVRKIDEEYFYKMEAIEFAVKYDDGRDPRGIIRADIVVVGVSRTSKTPLCMYLAHKGIKAANIPLVPEIAPPEEVFQIPRHRIVGLTIRPQKLEEIRTERLKTLGLAPNADYAKMERILKELSYAEEVMRRLGCFVVDVTNKAVEETASRVLELYYKGEKHGK